MFVAIHCDLVKLQQWKCSLLSSQIPCWLQSGACEVLGLKSCERILSQSVIAFKYSFAVSATLEEPLEVICVLLNIPPLRSQLNPQYKSALQTHQEISRVCYNARKASHTFGQALEEPIYILNTTTLLYGVHHILKWNGLCYLMVITITKLFFKVE